MYVVFVCVCVSTYYAWLYTYPFQPFLLGYYLLVMQFVVYIFKIWLTAHHKSMWKIVKYDGDDLTFTKKKKKQATNRYHLQLKHFSLILFATIHKRFLSDNFSTWRWIGSESIVQS